MMIKKNITFTTSFCIILIMQTCFAQEISKDTVNNIEKETCFDDTGSWTSVGLGFHFTLNKPYEFDQGPIYHRWLVLITHEYRYKNYFSFPFELHYWQWTKSNDRMRSFVLSVGLKFRYHISFLTIFGQMGIGIGSPSPIIHIPHEVGIEFPINANFRISTKLRGGLWIDGVNTTFLLVGLSIKN
ncbi:MAG: hypothetical protein QME52_04710 [Bacteroidota bacterium]|nr:hypothetical protein [Bacteroidota bacterium]